MIIPQVWFLFLYVILTIAASQGPSTSFISPIFYIQLACIFVEAAIIALSLVWKLRRVRSNTSDTQPTELHPSIQSDKLSPTHFNILEHRTAGQDLHYLRPLGEGSFGMVMLGKWNTQLATCMTQITTFLMNIDIIIMKCVCDIQLSIVESW